VKSRRKVKFVQMKNQLFFRKCLAVKVFKICSKKLKAFTVGTLKGPVPFLSVKKELHMTEKMCLIYEKPT